MPKDSDKQRVFTRRAVVLGGLQVLGLSAIVGRLAYLQLYRDDKYTALSENNRIKLKVIAPERGNILDWRGEILATNDKNYQLYMDMSGLKRDAFNVLIDRLHGLVGLPEKTRVRLTKMRLSASMRPELLKEHLTWQEVSAVEINAPELPGVYINFGQVRNFPLADETAHLLGYLGAVSEAELSANDTALMRLPDFKIGKNGAELMLENRLRGTAGITRVEVDVHGVAVREISKQESIAGESVKLTIDKRLQFFTSERIKAESAAVVVMEIETGNILTLASMPAFDPNSFSKGIAADYWKQLNDDKKAPLMNKAITGQYPPGSTFKMMVGMAALHSGDITPATSVHCPGHYYLGNHRFNCWKEGGHGSVNYKKAVVESCDTFFYTVANRIGIQSFIDMAREFGLGQLFNLGLVGEKAGIMPDPAWKQNRYQQQWTGGDTINCAIGQGYVLATPLQLCVMAARIANGGKAVVPKLVVSEAELNKETKHIACSDEVIALTQEAMAAVVNTPSGTAYGKRIIEPRFAFAGKTGTSQVRKITVRGQDQSKIPWEQRHHALFVGYAPVAAPKYAVSVLVEHGGGGSAAAAPIARDVLQKLQELMES